MIIEMKRVRGGAKPPTRSNPSDAGLDLYFNPKHEGFIPHPERDAVTVEPGQSVLLPTGFRFGVPQGYML